MLYCFIYNVEKYDFITMVLSCFRRVRPYCAEDDDGPPGDDSVRADRNSPDVSVSFEHRQLPGRLLPVVLQKDLL